MFIHDINDNLVLYDNVNIINEDILKADVRGMIEEEMTAYKEVVVIANLPYYITTPILMNFLMQKLPIDRYYVMIQKEVGERISADSDTKAYVSLSIDINYYKE